MLQRIGNIFIIFMAVILQASFFYNPARFLPVPNLILLVILIWVMRSGFREVFPWIIVSGIISDLALSVPFGSSTLTLISAAYIFDVLTKKYLVVHQGWRLGTVFLLVTIASAVSVVLYWIFNFSGHGIPDWQMAFRKLISLDSAVQILINPVFFLIIYWPMKKMEKFTTFYRQDSRIKI